MKKWVYKFKEGSADMRNLLGGKGAKLVQTTTRMASRFPMRSKSRFLQI